MDQDAENLYGSNMTPIEDFNLFGESTDLPDVVHCETIEARSVPNNWEFRPHRHSRLHQFLMVERGGGTGRFEAETHRIGPGSLANVPAGCVHGYSFAPGTEGWVVTVATEALDDSLAPGEGLRPILKTPAVTEGTAEIRHLVARIFETYRARDFARAHVLRARVALLAGLTARALAGAAPAARREPDLRRRFEDLLEENFRAHLPVSAYARRLAVTPTHLSRVLRTATGKPASRLITERLIREARRNLAFSNLPVSEIAYALGYDDPAHFSRVFSRATGLSPRAFRKSFENAP
ncbi:MAG: helix-turn-helix domain-containing protein [Alphaproteobacteria bacterium]|nr:MAG: helix-turn-helix domain-containing protein [Alphaproteobacteria bacterium]